MQICYGLCEDQLCCVDQMLMVVFIDVVVVFEVMEEFVFGIDGMVVVKGQCIGYMCLQEGVVFEIGKGYVGFGWGKECYCVVFF